MRYVCFFMFYFICLWRQREWVIIPLSTGSLVKFAQHQGLDQAEPRSTKLHLGLPCGEQEPRRLDRTCCLPGCITGSRIRNRAARSWTDTSPMGDGFSQRELIMLCYSTQSHVSFAYFLKCLNFWPASSLKIWKLLKTTKINTVNTYLPFIWIHHL